MADGNSMATSLGVTHLWLLVSSKAFQTQSADVEAGLHRLPIVEWLQKLSHDGLTPPVMLLPPRW